MFVIRNYVTTGGTVACALAIGYLMQNGPASQPDVQETRQAMIQPSGEGTVIAGLEGIVLTSATPNASTAPEPSAKVPPRAEPAVPQAQVNCDLRARAMAAPNATARLTLKAPCNPDETVELHHSGMTFSARTDKDGRLDLSIPALSEYAIFLISFKNQRGTVATTHIPDFSDYDRVALQWTGDTDLQLHALEFGASYGEAGHVWSNAGSSGTGQVVHFGMAGERNVEIYSVPRNLADANGTVALSVEAEVTPRNCGQDLDLQALELLDDQGLRSRELSITLPACDSGQDFLVLNNLFQDLTIAAK
ncbi:hypothetical protein [Ruegeria arenilitoris]|uniref:hypothetical protein n=1 Tax=Ruegeria arenilitoris TaxID=1173585 RepID=UPI0014813E74|nr:hypothetical protein [Ruegeria arenilitoris]